MLLNLIVSQKNFNLSFFVLLIFRMATLREGNEQRDHHGRRAGAGPHGLVGGRAAPSRLHFKGWYS